MRPLLHPSSSIVMLLFTLIILTNIPTCLRADGSQYTDCSSTLSCGDITDLTYPFWGESRPKGCGEPNLEITCDDGVPKFTVDSVTYRILASNLRAQSLTVARDDYWSNLCSTDYKNNTLDKTVLKYDDVNIVNVTLLYNCNGTPPSSYTPLQNCNLGVYAVLQNTPSPYGSCMSVVIPFPKAQVQVVYSNSSSAIQSVLKQGIGLKWPQSYDDCSKCYDSGGACSYEDGGFICLCKDGSSSKTSCSGSGSSSTKGNWKIKAALGALAAVGGVLVLFGLIICYRKRYFNLAQRRLVFEKTGSFANHNVEDFINSYDFLAPKRYSYSEVKRITNSFRDQLGQGGYGVVYKGSLPDGRNVAVKVISEFKGSGEEFINEVASISRTSHVNIVSLFGFCNEMNKRALIYEFMPNGSLDKFIYKMGSPNAICDLAWNTLYQITISIALGLEYLHRGCSTRILHLDIKPQNILLDEDFCPKIADFGLAKICKKKESIVSILGTRGTPGYIAPEVFSRTFGGVSHKSDVYSYGMLILEVVGGRKNYDNGGSNTSELYFPDWIYKDLDQGNIPTTCLVNTQQENDMVMKITLVSLWCIQANPSIRPSMSKVVEMLEGPLQAVPYPPKPILNFPELSPLQFSDISYSSIHETDSITPVENGSIK